MEHWSDGAILHSSITPMLHHSIHPITRSLNSPMTQSLNESLARRFEETRRGTLRLLELVDDHAFRAQPDPDFSPIGWHVGHMAAFEAHWLLQQCKGGAPISPAFMQFFSPLENPKPN